METRVQLIYTLPLLHSEQDCPAEKEGGKKQDLSPTRALFLCFAMAEKKLKEQVGSGECSP